MSEPTTETGRALAETLSEVPHYEYAPRLDTFAEDIAAIEAEARDQERARIAALLDNEFPFYRAGVTDRDTLADLRVALVLIANECVPPTDPHAIARIQSIAHAALAAGVRVAPSPTDHNRHPDCTCNFDDEESDLCPFHERMLGPLTWRTLAFMVIDLTDAVRGVAPSPETPGPVEALTWALDYIRRHGGVDNDYHDIERAAFADAVLAATKEPTP